ncbi:MAG: ATP synthase subunit I [Casimicrobiaceae bacterium]
MLKWQVIATAILAATAGAWSGTNGMVSAILGGGLNVVASLVYAALLAMGTAGGTRRGAQVALVAMFRAEAGKVLAIIAQLWVVLSMYQGVVIPAFFGTFVITVIVFSMAFFVRD